MEHCVLYDGLAFDWSFISARLKDGREISFTRAERALLLLFTANAGKLLTRSQLLDAMSDAGSEVSDRNVDYAINRLRTKLGDSARNPSLIATRYGEGYVWIAYPVQEHAPVEALLVIGPVLGIDRAPPAARACLLRLRHAIDAQTADDQAVVLDENWNAEAGGVHKIRFSLDVGFYDDGTLLHFAAVLRDAPTRQMLKTFRLLLDHKGGRASKMDIDDVASSIRDTMWRQATVGAGTLAGLKDAPLEVRMHDAARLFMTTDESWIEMGEALAQARRDKPDDPETALMWAMHLYARIVQNMADIDKRAAFEAEIEALVFDYLPAFQDNPVFLLGAAKLLMFVGRGHLALAEQLAERAFASSAAFAAAFSVLGQIKMCKGEMRAALDLYDRGLELAEPGSEFRIYLLVLKCAALLAMNDRAALEKTESELYALKPVTRSQVGLTLAPEGPLPPDLDVMMVYFNVERARQAIAYVYYTFARLFERRRHRENMMRGIIHHLAGRFGPEIVPDEVRRAVPGLGFETAVT